MRGDWPRQRVRALAYALIISLGVRSAYESHPWKKSKFEERLPKWQLSDFCAQAREFVTTLDKVVRHGRPNSVTSANLGELKSDLVDLSKFKEAEFSDKIVELCDPLVYEDHEFGGRRGPTLVPVHPDRLLAEIGIEKSGGERFGNVKFDGEGHSPSEQAAARRLAQSSSEGQLEDLGLKLHVFFSDQEEYLNDSVTRYQLLQQGLFDPWYSLYYCGLMGRLAAESFLGSFLAEDSTLCVVGRKGLWIGNQALWYLERRFAEGRRPRLQLISAVNKLDSGRSDLRKLEAFAKEYEIDFHRIPVTSELVRDQHFFVTERFFFWMHDARPVMRREGRRTSRKRTPTLPQRVFYMAFRKTAPDGQNRDSIPGPIFEKFKSVITSEIGRRGGVRSGSPEEQVVQRLVLLTKNWSDAGSRRK